MQQLTNFNGAGKSQKAVNLDLSTPGNYQQQLEILLYQKAQQGEDIEPCINALNYFSSKNKQIDLLNKIWTETVKERSALNSLQRVVITAFAILGMIAVFNGAFPSKSPSSSMTTPSAIN